MKTFDEWKAAYHQKFDVLTEKEELIAHLAWNDATIHSNQKHILEMKQHIEAVRRLTGVGA